MKPYKMSEEEKEYLSTYDITHYERPSIAADIVVFSIMGNMEVTKMEKIRDAKNFRKLPEKKLKVLLIKRASYPYKDCWALPGGFCRKNEDVYETAKRELYEETHIKDAYLQLSAINGEAGRDPRGWIISHSFLSLLEGEKCRLRAGSDAWEACWFDVDIKVCKEEKITKDDSVLLEKEYQLRLVHSDIHAGNLINITQSEHAFEPETLTAVIRERKEFRNYHEHVQYEIIKNEGLAFDHAKIITCALLSLRKQAQKDGRIVFDLMPEFFTLTELQKAFEMILDKKLVVANFRRKMADYVVESDQIIEGAGHRPARLFKRNLDRLVES